MKPGTLSYSPDDWAHDLEQWWKPLASLAGQADCGAESWLGVLGVEEFFDQRLLGQVKLRTPWLCLAVSALAAAAACHWARIAPGPDQDAEDRGAILAITTLDLAVALEELRWSGASLGAGVISTAALIGIGRQALADRGFPAAAGGPPGPVSLAAGWLLHSGGELPAAPGASVPGHSRPAGDGPIPSREAAALIAAAAFSRNPAPSAVAWGTAHLVERLAGGRLDNLAVPRKPDDVPAHAWVNVLLVSDHGEVGLFESRRQRSALPVPAGNPVPDLARLSFAHTTPDFLGAISDAFAAAAALDVLARPGELITWNLQLRHGSHPLAERSVSGRSAGLGGYVAFRSLGDLRVFSDREVAFTGQVSRDGRVGKVKGASGKIRAAGEQGMRRIIHPVGQVWRDPGGAVVLEGVERAEDAVIAASQPLRGIRRYLQSVCRLVAPEPWLQTWLSRQGRQELEMPLLDVMCRQLRLPHAATPGAGAPQAASVIPAPDGGLPAAAGREPWQEPDLAPCPAHLLACTNPGISFVISADAGCGSTVAAKRMVAEAARQALETLRAIHSPDRLPAFVLPLYVSLGELPSSWNNLVQASVEALPELADSSLEISAALAQALRSDDERSWRALVVVDGTDRTRRADGDAELDRERDFLALITGNPGRARGGWRPSQPPQIVLCGRPWSPAHQDAADALRRERPHAVATVGLDPLSGREIERYLTAMPGGLPPLTGKSRDLAANPLLLAISVIAGHVPVGDSSPADLFHRAIEVLLGSRDEHRRLLAEIAFRAASAKRRRASSPWPTSPTTSRGRPWRKRWPATTRGGRWRWR